MSPDPDEPVVLDDAFVAAAQRREDPGDVRAERARRIAGEHRGSLAWRADAPVLRPVVPAQRVRRDRRGLLAVVLCVAVGLGAWRAGLLPGAVAAAGGDVRLSGRSGAAPPGAAVHSLHRLLPAPAVPATGSSYAFLLSGDRSAPVAWNACRPVHVVVRPDGAPPGGRALVDAALEQLSAVTGLQVVDDGDTDEAPADDRPAYLPQRYGRQWAPVLVAWSDPVRSPDLAGAVAGFAGPVGYRPAGQAERWVSGTVVLDGPQLTALGGTSVGQASARGVVLHELGHLVGLAHVDDPTQLMNPTSDSRSPTAYAAGDLHGLAVLGSRPCP